MLWNMLKMYKVGSMDRPPLYLLSQLHGSVLRMYAFLGHYALLYLDLCCLVPPRSALPSPHLLNLASSYLTLPSSLLNSMLHCPTLHYSLRIPLKTISKVRAMPKDGLPFPGTTQAHTHTCAVTYPDITFLLSLPLNPLPLFNLSYCFCHCYCVSSCWCSRVFLLRHRNLFSRALLHGAV